ncbi:hypothetical protein DY000_02046400 [Brassica cretica]|uniref:TIR domain-containing protein n=1 Tax=Brassica cretica TaxID=69181 RepID=A0ABQ7ENV6_BRACR|nr:hypothetical protein DY000_02046400 [Brassica cretica]
MLYILIFSEDSVAFIVILSPDYAKSRWCLDELAKLCDLRASLGRPILPIFYEVDPWHFWKQSHFEKGFEEHAKRFREEEIERWRGAMNVIGHISSYVYRYMRTPAWAFGSSDRARVGSLRVRILRDVPQIKLGSDRCGSESLDELNAQMSWTDTILDELSRTDTHFDKLSKQVQSSELVRPPEKLEMANLLSDEPTTNSIMPKVIIHVLNVQESIGLDGFQKDSKTDLFGPNEETDKNWLKQKDGFQPDLKGICLGPYQEHILHFQSPGRDYIKRQSKFQSKT